MAPGAAGSGLAAGACQAFQVVFHNQLCGWLFRCGCVWEWSGGWACCNVHNPAGPRCPWCTARHYVSWTTDCLVLALMVLALHEASRRGWPRPAAAAAAAAVFFVAGAAVALAFKVATGYPYFISAPCMGGTQREVRSGGNEPSPRARAAIFDC